MLLNQLQETKGVSLPAKNVVCWRPLWQAAHSYKYPSATSHLSHQQLKGWMGFPEPSSWGQWLCMSTAGTYGHLMGWPAAPALLRGSKGGGDAAKWLSPCQILVPHSISYGNRVWANLGWGQAPSRLEESLPGSPDFSLARTSGGKLLVPEVFVSKDSFPLELSTWF